MNWDFDPRRILAEGLSAAVASSGKSRATIAEGAGVSIDHLSRIMNGQRNPSADALFGLAETLGWRISEFYAKGEALVLGDRSEMEWEEIVSGLQEALRGLRAKARLDRAEGRPGTEVPQ